jgi:hypothetical protein
MHKMLFALIVLPATAGAGELSTGDRHRLIAHLEMTEAWLQSEITGLSAKQRTILPSAEAWSIHNIIEHLAVAEPQYWQQVQDAVKKGAVGFQSKAKDSDILWYGIDRTNRQRTGAAREPKGQFAETAQGLASFRKLRAAMRAYAQSTSDDLRGTQLIDSQLDVYQWFLMISAHSQRHILQIREIKANAAFPK